MRSWGCGTSRALGRCFYILPLGCGLGREGMSCGGEGDLPVSRSKLWCTMDSQGNLWKKQKATQRHKPVVRKSWVKMAETLEDTILPVLFCVRVSIDQGAHTFNICFRQDSGTHYSFWFPLSGNLWSREASMSSLRNSNFTLDPIPFLKKKY